MNRYFNIAKNNKILSAFSLVLALLVLITFAISPAFACNHECSGELCVICIATASARFVKFFALFIGVLLVALVFAVMVLRRAYSTETLVTLKRKLTI